MDLTYPHRPVLVHEVVEHLISTPEGIYVDGTSGGGGHSLAIAENLRGKGHLICLDRDPEAVRATRKRLASMGKRISVLRGSYADLDEVLGKFRLENADGILLDLGMSSSQLEKSGRGFSFSRDESLDMRMDPDDVVTARHLVNRLSAKELEKILHDYGEEGRAGKIARAIVQARGKRPIETSCQLAQLINASLPPSHRDRSRHPATRTFQALRIAVNRELDNLGIFLRKAPSLIAKGGRLAVLSYHSLEDRMVKRAMTEWEKPCTCPPDFPQCVCGKVQQFRRPFKKALTPTQTEIQENPRARSAKLRVAERI